MSWKSSRNTWKNRSQHPAFFPCHVFKWRKNKIPGLVSRGKTVEQRAKGALRPSGIVKGIPRGKLEERPARGGTWGALRPSEIEKGPSEICPPCWIPLAQTWSTGIGFRATHAIVFSKTGSFPRVVAPGQAKGVPDKSGNSTGQAFHPGWTPWGCPSEIHFAITGVNFTGWTRFNGARGVKINSPDGIVNIKHSTGWRLSGFFILYFYHVYRVNPV